MHQVKEVACSAEQPLEVVGVVCLVAVHLQQVVAPLRVVFLVARPQEQQLEEDSSVVERMRHRKVEARYLAAQVLEQAAQRVNPEVLALL